jgi:hypothetical protein
VKVIINSSGRERKEYTNLPEHDAARELLRARLEQKKQNSQQAGNAAEQNTPTASFGPREEKVAPETNDLQTDQQEQLDPLENFLSDGGAVEHEEHASWKNSRWVPMLLVAAVAIFGGIWYLAASHEQELILQRVSVSGASMLKEAEVVALANINRSEKFYDIDLKKIQERLLKHSLIKSAHPRRDLNPATIVLEIEERHPVALARSGATGEAFIIDADGMILRPKLMAGLRDPQKLMQVPLISGVRDNDTASYRAMAQLVMMMESIDTGALKGAIGELARTPTGALVIYTTETQTPIFIGSPADQPFRSALEVERGAPNEQAHAEPHFIRQLHLLAKLWKKKLEPELRTGHDFYVDARFSGEVIVKRKPGFAIKDTTAHPGPLLSSVISSPTVHEHP